MSRADVLLDRLGTRRDPPARPELVRLVETGVLTPSRLAPGRAIDFGCGSGANLRFLARHGFAGTGVDRSSATLRLAWKRAGVDGLGASIRFIEADLATGEISGVEGPFDLLLDFGTLQDLEPAGRRAMADLAASLARPGATFLLWCFWAHRSDLPRARLTGPTRRSPAIEPGEEAALFGDAFSIERLRPADAAANTAWFLMTRR